MDQSRFDSQLATNREEPLEEAAVLLRGSQQRQESSEELPREEPGKYPEESQDQRSDKLQENGRKALPKSPLERDPKGHMKKNSKHSLHENLDHLVTQYIHVRNTIMVGITVK